MKEHSILVVDDEEIVLKAIGIRLEKKGYSVSLASSGEKAIEMIEKKIASMSNNDSIYPTQFDLVITDLMMLGINGIKLLEKIKSLDPEIMVMILTGHGDLQTAIEALRLGADEYLLKTCQSEELFFRVEECMKKIELQRKVNYYEQLLPVCCVCKKICDDTKKSAHKERQWLSIEEYFRKKEHVHISHTYCNNCLADVHKDIAKIIA